jgi:hypothetical protein
MEAGWTNIYGSEAGRGGEKQWGADVGFAENRVLPAPICLCTPRAPVALLLQPCVVLLTSAICLLQLAHVGEIR